MNGFRISPVEVLSTRSRNTNKIFEEYSNLTNNNEKRIVFSFNTIIFQKSDEKRSHSLNSHSNGPPTVSIMDRRNKSISLYNKPDCSDKKNSFVSKMFKHVNGTKGNNIVNKVNKTNNESLKKTKKTESSNTINVNLNLNLKLNLNMLNNNNKTNNITFVKPALSTRLRTISKTNKMMPLIKKSDLESTIKPNISTKNIFHKPSLTNRPMKPVVKKESYVGMSKSILEKQKILKKPLTLPHNMNTILLPNQNKPTLDQKTSDLLKNKKKLTNTNRMRTSFDFRRINLNTLLKNKF